MSEIDEFYAKNNVPIPLMQYIWGRRHGIKANHIEQAAKEYYADVISGKTETPEPIECGWNVMRRAIAMNTRKIGQNRIKIKNLESEKKILEEELAFSKLPWWKKLNWRSIKTS